MSCTLIAAFHAPEILTSANANNARIAGAASGSQPQSSPASRSGSLSRAGSDSDSSDKLMSNRRVLCSGVKMDVWSMGITLFALVFGGEQS